MNQVTITKNKRILVGTVEQFPKDGGACVKVGELQVAIFHFQSRNEWYACQNLCPHSNYMVLARGLIGDVKGEPKVSCPMHKKSFSLKSGECIGEELSKIDLYPVFIENHNVFLEIPERT